MKKFAKWLVMVFVVSCICALVLCATGCGKKDKTIKSVVVNNNGELVAEYDDGTNDVLGTLGNVKSAEEKDGKLVITLKDGSTITCDTAATVGKTVKSISVTATGVLHVEYTDGTTEDLDVNNAGCKHENVKYIEVVEHTATFDDAKNDWTYTDGVYIVACLDCGYTKTEVGVHHNIITETVDPTCTAEGYTSEHCTICDYEKEHYDVKPMIDHDYEEYDVVEPGATICENGAQRIKTCKVCGHVEAEVVPAQGHKITFDATSLRKPTATAAGEVKGKCDVCFKPFTFPLPVLGAKDDNGNAVYAVADVSKREKCTDLGEVKYTITLEGNEFSFTVAGVAGKHTLNGVEINQNEVLYITDADVADGKLIILDGATLTCKNSVTAIFDCDTCNTKAVSVKVQKKHVEKADSQTNVVPATCTTEGSYDYVCDFCGETLHDGKIDKIAHKYDKDLHFDEETSTFTVVCSVCGDVYTETDITAWEKTVADCQKPGEYILTLKNGEVKTIKYAEKTGHVIYTKANGENVAAGIGDEFLYEEVKDYVTVLDGVTVTCTKAETAIFDCKVCGQKGNSIKVRGSHKKPADDSKIHTKPATCETDGYTYYKCENEGCTGNNEDGFVHDEVIKALGHKYAYTPVKDDEGNVTALKGHCANYSEENPDLCENPDVTIECTSAEVTDSKASTCVTNGYRIWTCVTADGTIDVKEELPLTNHTRKVDGKDVPVESYEGIVKGVNDDDIVVLDGAAACRKDAAAVPGYFVCTTCGMHKSVTVKADHVVDTTKENKSVPATCIAPGKVDYWCANCGEHIEKDLPQLAHDYETVIKLENSKYMAYNQCKNCDEHTSEDVSADVEVKKLDAECVPATCVAEGKNVYEVKYEGKTYTVTEVVPVTDHHPEGEYIVWNVEVKDKDGKLVETVTYYGKVCKDCKKVIVKTSKTVHTPAPVEEPTEPTTNA